MNPEGEPEYFHPLDQIKNLDEVSAREFLEGVFNLALQMGDAEEFSISKQEEVDNKRD